MPRVFKRSSILGDHFWEPMYGRSVTRYRESLGTSPVATGGPSPPKQGPQNGKWNYISVEILPIFRVSSPPSENFLATVLLGTTMETRRKLYSSNGKQMNRLEMLWNIADWSCWLSWWNLQLAFIQNRRTCRLSSRSHVLLLFSRLSLACSVFFLSREWKNVLLWECIAPPR